MERVAHIRDEFVINGERALASVNDQLTRIRALAGGGRDADSQEIVRLADVGLARATFQQKQDVIQAIARRTEPYRSLLGRFVDTITG